LTFAAEFALDARQDRARRVFERTEGSARFNAGPSVCRQTVTRVSGATDVTFPWSTSRASGFTLAEGRPERKTLGRGFDLARSQPVTWALRSPFVTMHVML
jgi:hypothetical protein